MRFSTSNFLYEIKNLIMGRNGDDIPASGTAQSADGGIKVDKAIPLSAVVNATEFPVITDNTVGTPTTTFAALTGTYATDVVTLRNILSQVAKQFNALNLQIGSSNSSVPAIVVAAAAATVGTFSFPVPRDYDEASDHLIIRLAVQLANADAAITITGTPTILPIATGTAATGTAVTGTAPFSQKSLSLSTTEQIVEIKLSGKGLKRDDVVAVAVALVGTTTGNTYVYSIEKHYDSTLVSYNDTTSDDNPSNTTKSAQPGFGNPLR